MDPDPDANLFKSPSNSIPTAMRKSSRCKDATSGKIEGRDGWPKGRNDGHMNLRVDRENESTGRSGKMSTLRRTSTDGVHNTGKASLCHNPLHVFWLSCIALFPLDLGYRHCDSVPDGALSGLLDPCTHTYCIVARPVTGQQFCCQPAVFPCGSATPPRSRDPGPTWPPSNLQNPCRPTLEAFLSRRLPYEHGPRRRHAPDEAVAKYSARLLPDGMPMRFHRAPSRAVLSNRSAAL